MNNIYIVIKDELVEFVGFDREKALEQAKVLSGISAGISLANVSLWESVIGGKPVMIYSVSWECAGPLEPQVYTNTSSPNIAPQS
jgi:hypothetical protein